MLNLFWGSWIWYVSHWPALAQKLGTHGLTNWSFFDFLSIWMHLTIFFCRIFPFNLFQHIFHNWSWSSLILAAIFCCRPERYHWFYGLWLLIPVHFTAFWADRLYITNDPNFRRHWCMMVKRMKTIPWISDAALMNLKSPLAPMSRYIYISIPFRWVRMFSVHSPCSNWTLIWSAYECFTPKFPN